MPPLLLALLQAAAMAQAPDTNAFFANVVIDPLDGSLGFPTDISKLGDINNDGKDDFLVSSKSGPNNPNGRVWVLFGPDASVDPSGAYVFTGSSLSWFGFSITGQSDVDGDGTPDIVVGAPLDNNLSGFDTNDFGRVSVYSGADASLLQLWNGVMSDDNLGYRVAPFANVDQFQGDEILFLTDHVLASQYKTQRRSNGDPTSFIEFDGLYVSNAGRSNFQDMTPDIVAGDPNDATNGVDAGHLVYRDGVTGAAFISNVGPFGDPGEMLGQRVEFMGDIDADGFGDVLSSGFAFDNNRGRVRIVSSLGPLHNTLRLLDGESNQDQFGKSVANIGDVNGDGVADFAVGAPRNDPSIFGNPSTNAGRVYIFSGATGVRLRTFSGEANNDFFGEIVRGIGDINGDTIPDIAVAAPSNGNPHDGVGRVYVFFMPCTSVADLNGDGVVNGVDLAQLLVEFGPCDLPPAPTCPADINNDNVVDGVDLALLLVNWGTCTPTGAPAAMAGDPAGGNLGSQSTMSPSGAPSQQSQSQSGQAYMLSIIAQFGFTDLPSYYTWLETASDQEQAATISAMIDAIARNSQ